MKLYNYWRSSCSWRVRIALAYKKLPFEYIPVHLVRDGGEQHRTAHQSKNAMEQVPVLEVTDKNGKPHFISQSVAILEYLEEVYPNPPLLPKLPTARADVRKLVQIVNSGIQPFQGLRILAHISQPGKFDKTDWLKFFIEHGLTALETETEKTNGKFSVGDEITMADACLVPQMAASRRFGIETKKYSVLSNIEERCLQHPAFFESHPDQQIDSEKA